MVERVRQQAERALPQPTDHPAADAFSDEALRREPRQYTYLSDDDD